MMKLRRPLDYARRVWEHYSQLSRALQLIRHGLDAPLIVSSPSDFLANGYL